MREILFRAKRTDDGEWIYGDFINSWHKLNTKSTPMIYNTLGKTEVDPSTVCQFTGLTDKNGNKIFEGDIIQGKIVSAWRTDFIKCEVVYDKYGFEARHYTYLKDNVYYSSYKVMFSKKIEVIGNIFDNKELLQ